MQVFEVYDFVLIWSGKTMKKQMDFRASTFVDRTSANFDL